MPQTSDGVTRLGLFLVALWFLYRGQAKRDREREEQRERLRERLDREEMERREQWMRDGRPI